MDCRLSTSEWPEIRTSARAMRLPIALLLLAGCSDDPLTRLTGALEVTMGRTLTYQRGPVRLWSGDIRSDQNSQQFSDPYTFTHLVHGALFYGMTKTTIGSSSLGLRMIAATAAEAHGARRQAGTQVRRGLLQVLARVDRRRRVAGDAEGRKARAHHAGHDSPAAR